MNWLDRVVPLHNADDRTADWMAKARTSGARLRIRRWSRLESTALVAVLAGVVLIVLASIATPAMVIWFHVAGIERTDVYVWLWGFAGGLSLAGGILMVVSGRQRLAACFADGYVTTGRVDRVSECPGGGDDSTVYELRVSARLSDGAVLHRRVYRDGADPRRRTGGAIRFRHNTLDPDDVHDVLFDGYPGADRARSERVQFRFMWILVAVLVAWLAFGFVREPAASWQERMVVGILICSFAAPMIGTRGFRRTLPALDRTPRQATVTGQVHFAVDPDSDSDMPAYDLIEVRVDMGGEDADTTIADIVAAESFTRFAVGSVWEVYAFKDPAELNNGHSTRVILTEAHEDVVRSGYHLGTHVLHHSPGPGSELLHRRFADEHRRARRAAGS